MNSKPHSNTMFFGKDNTQTNDAEWWWRLGAAALTAAARALVAWLARRVARREARVTQLALASL